MGLRLRVALPLLVYPALGGVQGWRRNVEDLNVGGELDPVVFSNEQNSVVVFLQRLGDASAYVFVALLRSLLSAFRGEGYNFFAHETHGKTPLPVDVFFKDGLVLGDL